jgi:hypothetical protein
MISESVLRGPCVEGIVDGAISRTREIFSDISSCLLGSVSNMQEFVIVLLFTPITCIQSYSEFLSLKDIQVKSNVALPFPLNPL